MKLEVWAREGGTGGPGPSPQLSGCPPPNANKLRRHCENSESNGMDSICYPAVRCSVSRSAVIQPMIQHDVVTYMASSGTWVLMLMESGTMQIYVVPKRMVSAVSHSHIVAASSFAQDLLVGVIFGMSRSEASCSAWVSRVPLLLFVEQKLTLSSSRLYVSHPHVAAAYHL